MVKKEDVEGMTTGLLWELMGMYSKWTGSILGCLGLDRSVLSGRYCQTRFTVSGQPKWLGVQRKTALLQVRPPILGPNDVKGDYCWSGI